MTSPAPFIPPTVGRVLWFYPSQRTGESDFARHAAGGPYAAIIAHVLDDSMVNLTVFDANGVPHSRTSVPLIHVDDMVADHAFCGWMPFQKGQAARQDTQAAAQVSAAKQSAPASAVTEPDLAVKSVPPRITPAEIEAAIAAEYSFTVDKALQGCPLMPCLEHVTVCVLVLKNGTKIVGVNEGPVSAANFDAEIGRRYAREKAIDQVWPLLGYELRSKLAAVPSTFQGRVLAEKTELEERIQKLVAFLGSPAYEALAEREKSLLVSQATAMQTYANVLVARIASFGQPAND